MNRALHTSKSEPSVLGSCRCLILFSSSLSSRSAHLLPLKKAGLKLKRARVVSIYVSYQRQEKCSQNTSCTHHTTANARLARCELVVGRAESLIGFLANNCFSATEKWPVIQYTSGWIGTFNVWFLL